jgi:glycosyltransferase involved in cell wall biosynthesis
VPVISPEKPKPVTHPRGQTSDSTLPLVLILFPDDWAPYSPTLLRLVELLSESMRVRVYYLETGRADNTSLDPSIYRPIRVHGRLTRLLRRLACYRPLRTLLLAAKAKADSKVAEHVIAIDADGATAARLLNRKFHFLSLETGWHPVLRRLTRSHGLSILIQSQERLDYQFGKRLPNNIPTFFIQNAPDFSRFLPTQTLEPASRSQPRLIYLGHVIPLHGLVPMLELVKVWPAAVLTLRGMHADDSMDIIRSRYADLLESGRLKIDEKYIAESDLPVFLSQFHLGLCFYELGRHKRNFNYISAPAGKMFNYFAAGLPVIASNLVGLNPITLHSAGIQVSTHDPSTILNAALTIMENYDRYAKGALRAAQHYDFGRSAGRFVEFLMSTNRMT